MPNPAICGKLAGYPDWVSSFLVGHTLLVFTALVLGDPSAAKSADGVLR